MFSAPSPTVRARLPHGDLNGTSLHGRRVIKDYLGPDAEDRRTREVNALTFLAGQVPVPRLIEHDRARIVTRLVEGTAGLDLLLQLPDEVLFEVGRAARTLHRVDLSRAYGTQHDRSVLVHGDFGPHNMIFDARRLQATAIVDWEHAHVGDPVEDLAWAEWVVRTQHPDLARSVDRLFDGYGRRPGWPQRHALMVSRCRAVQDFFLRWPGADPGEADTWQRRVEATLAFRE